MTLHLVDAVTLAGPGWNPIDDVRQILALHFMVNAVRAGTVAALLGAVVGWFMVLRRQSFVGHTLAVVSFPGAAAAIWLGVSASAGYFAGSIAAALVIAMVPRTQAGRAGSQESAVIGTVQAFALAAGALFVSLYGGFLDSITGLLFGSFLGVSDGQVTALVVVAGVVLVAMAVLARPLLFATVDRDVAVARGVPERALSVAFLLVLGCTAAEVSQVTGTLLVFALLVMPAAAAQHLTVRPVVGLCLAVVFALLVVWSALGVAFYSTWPVGFFVSSFGFAVYLAAIGIRLAAGRWNRPPKVSSATPAMASPGMAAA
jgi:zinc/manganese transport system permease protein